EARPSSAASSRWSPNRVRATLGCTASDPQSDEAEEQRAKVLVEDSQPISAGLKRAAPRLANDPWKKLEREGSHCVGLEPPGIGEQHDFRKRAGRLGRCPTNALVSRASPTRAPGCVTIQIRHSEVDALVTRRLLAPEERADRGALRQAIHRFLDMTLGRTW